MIAKYATIVLVGTVLSTGIAFGQTSSKKDSPETGTRASSGSTQRHWQIGTIQDFVVDKDAGIDLVIIDVGGVVNMDERNLAVGYKLLKWVNTPVGVASPTSTSLPATTWIFEAPKPDAAGIARQGQWYPDHAVLAATKSQLKNMRTFEY